LSELLWFGDASYYLVLGKIRIFLAVVIVKS